MIICDVIQTCISDITFGLRLYSFVIFPLPLLNEAIYQFNKTDAHPWLVPFLYKKRILNIGINFKDFWQRHYIECYISNNFTVCPNETRDNYWTQLKQNIASHDDVIKLKHFPSYWPFVRGIHRPVTRSFDVFFDLRLNKRSSKKSWGWWLETPSCSLWRHRYVLAVMIYLFHCLPVGYCHFCL